MPKPPFFSVVIPLYNKENHIIDTIKSVLNQTFQDFEIIIVDDGSTDNGLAKVKTIEDIRIKLFPTTNHGVSYARNYGIKKAKAEFIAFLDADDYWFSNHLETLKKMHNAFPRSGLYANAYSKKIGDFVINSTYKHISKKTDWMGVVEDYFASSVINSIAWTSAVMAPKKTIIQVGGFDENITLGAGEDTDLWIKIALKHQIAFCNTVTALHNLHADNRISNSNTNLRCFIDLDKYEGIAETNKSLKKYLDINRFSIAIQYKLVGNKQKAGNYIKKINSKNLNYKQQFLLKQNNAILKTLIKIQNLLKALNINLTSFK